ncbi:WD40 repeat domain-containing protein [Desulfoplanes sp.]
MGVFLFGWLLLYATPECGAFKGGRVRMLPDTGGHTAAIRDMDVSGDGSLLVTGSEDKTLRLWDLVHGRCLKTVPMTTAGGQQGAIFALDIAPNGRMVAVGGWMGDKADGADMGRVFLLSLPQGRPIKVLEHAPSPVHALAFSPDNRFLAVGSQDGFIRIWDVDRGGLVHGFHGHAGAVRSLAWIDSGRFVSGGDDGKILAWGVDGLVNLGVLSGHTDRVACLAVSPQGNTLFSGGYDKSVREWDLATMRYVRQLTVQAGPVLGLSFNRDGSRVLVTSGGMGRGRTRCVVLDRETARMQTLFLEHAGGVEVGRFIPGTSLAATAGQDRTVFLWDTGTGKVRHRLTGHGRAIVSARFALEGDQVFWTLEKPLSVFQEMRGGFPAAETLRMRFSDKGYLGVMPAPMPTAAQGAILEVGDRRLVRQVGADTRSSLLEVYDGKYCRLKIERNFEDGKEHCASSLTPDGKYVISGGGYGALAMYRVRSGEKVHGFKGHTGAVVCLAVSPDGTRLVSGSQDQTVRLWNLETGELLATVLYADSNEWVAWTPAGYYACSPSGDFLLKTVVEQKGGGVPETLPVDGFGRYCYRPDIVKATLLSGRSRTALAKCSAPRISQDFLDSHRPPGIEILRPDDGSVIGSRNVSLLFRLQAHAAEPAGCTLRVNGRLAGVEQKDGWGSGRHNVPLDMETGVNTIGVECVSTQGTRARAEVRTILVDGSGIKGRGPGTLYYLGLGIGRLEIFGRMDLPGPSTDVNMVGRILKPFKKRTYDRVNLRLVSDDYGTSPTRAHIQKGVAWINRAGPRDTVVVMVVGQGVTTPDGRPVLLARDSRSDGHDGYRRESVIDLETFMENLGKLEARVLVLCDIAHSGPLDMTRVLRMARDKGVAVLSATQGHQRTGKEYPSLPCLPFAYSLFKGLGPGLFADTDRDGRVGIRELARYVQEEVQGIDDTLMPALVLPVGYGDFVVGGSTPSE